MGPKIVVMTSTYLKDTEGIIQLFGSLKDGDKITKVSMDIPKIAHDKDDYVFTGTGDILSAMLLVHTDKYPDDF